MEKKIRVTVWNEYLHEQEYASIRAIYPEGIHGAIAGFLKKEADIEVRTAVLDDPECGLTEELLSNTDVLIWWAHARHEDIPDEIAERVCGHILNGMGFIGLHSAHLCKVLRKILGTTMTLQWKNDDSEILYCTSPTHPIAKGIDSPIVLPREELYSEYFDIPRPDDVIFTGWFQGGAVFRSGVTFTRGYGKIFYFQPGHEEYPIYYEPHIQKIIVNAVRYCSSEIRAGGFDCLIFKKI